METKETTKNEKTVKQLEVNLKEVIGIITETVKENNWVMKVDHNKVDSLPFEMKTWSSRFKKNDSIIININGNMSMNSRKNIAKRLWKVKQKPSRRNINILFLVLKNLDIIQNDIKIELSEKEQQIQLRRKIWIKLRNETEKARLDYKTEKGDFYKNNLVK